MTARMKREIHRSCITWLLCSWEVFYYSHWFYSGVETVLLTCHLHYWTGMSQNEQYGSYHLNISGCIRVGLQLLIVFYHQLISDYFLDYWWMVWLLKCWKTMLENSQITISQSLLDFFKWPVLSDQFTEKSWTHLRNCNQRIFGIFAWKMIILSRSINHFIVSVLYLVILGNVANQWEDLLRVIVIYVVCNSLDRPKTDIHVWLVLELKQLVD